MSALDYAKLGIPVFPCVNKRPITANGFKDATTDQDQVSRWWTETPDAQIGVPTGVASGLFVLDLDVDKITGETVGETSLADLGIIIPDTVPRVRTGSGGTHFYFIHEPGLKSSANKIAPSVDTRGDGGYVIAPPSVGYTWSVNGNPAPIPHKLYGLLPRNAENGPVASAPAVAPDRAAVPLMKLELLTTIESATNTLASRDDWFAVILAVKHDVAECPHAAQSVFREALMGWSSRWPDADERAGAMCAAAWDSAKPDGRLTVATALRLLRPPSTAVVSSSADPVAPPSGEYLTTHDQAQWFAGCVYIVAEHAILTPNGKILTPEKFAVMYGGKEFQMSSDGTRPSRNAFEAFTQNRACVFPRVSGKCFTPNLPFGEIQNDMVNTYKRAEIITTDEPVDPFLDLMKKMLPNENDRNIVLSWCAALVQNPGRKFQWSVVLQGTEGNGKTFLLKCIEYAVGQDLTHLPNPEDMNEKYNTYIENKLFIGVEEVHMSGRRDLMDRLKKYITNDRVEIRGMNQDKRMADNLTNWMFLTNFKDAILKSKNDRRYAIFFTGQQCERDIKRDGMDGQFFPDLWGWARNGGFAAVAGYLGRFKVLDEYNPLDKCHRAPLTSATHEAIDHSMGSVEQEIQEAIEMGMPGFCGGWLSSIKVKELLDMRGFRHISWHIMRDAVEALGYTQCKLWEKGRAKQLIAEGNKRPRLYCTETVHNSATRVEDYLNAQGYPSSLPSI